MSDPSIYRRWGAKVDLVVGARPSRLWRRSRLQTRATPEKTYSPRSALPQRPVEQLRGRMGVLVFVLRRHVHLDFGAGEALFDRLRTAIITHPPAMTSQKLMRR
jgi:hypothetical protein